MEHLYEVDQLKQQLDNLYDIAFEQYKAQEKVEEVYARLKRLNIWMKTYSISGIDAPNKIIKQWQETLQRCIEEIEAE